MSILVLRSGFGWKEGRDEGRKGAGKRKETAGSVCMYVVSLRVAESIYVIFDGKS